MWIDPNLKMQVDTMLIWDIEKYNNYINFDIGLFFTFNTTTVLA
jgi:hypothetical protein